MQKIIVTQTATEIKLDNLQGNEIVAYRSQNSVNYCILARLTKKDDGQQKYGFVAMNCSDSSPRFVEKTWFDAIRLASKTRSVVTFANMNELLTAMLNKTF
jgi:hypothetical protein